MAYDLFQDETRQFKPHPRHHRYHSSLITNKLYHNQEDTSVAYIPILIISIVISLFLIVNCYKKESSPHIPDLTETSHLSAFLSRAFYNNKVTVHHSLLLSKVKTRPISPPTSNLFPAPSSTLTPSPINRPCTHSIEDNLNPLQSEALRSPHDDEYNKQLIPSAHFQGKQLARSSAVPVDYDEYRYHQPSSSIRYYQIDSSTANNNNNLHQHFYHQLYQYKCPNVGGHHHSHHSNDFKPSTSPFKSIITVTPNPIVSLLSSPTPTPPPSQSSTQQLPLQQSTTTVHLQSPLISNL